MSEWYQVEDEDINEEILDRSDKEVAFFVKADYNGRIYLSVSFDQIKKLAALIDKKCE